MRVAMIGAGYVGLVSGACFADFGHDVICIDKDAKKVAALNSGEIPIFEPALPIWLRLMSGRNGFTSPPIRPPSASPTRCLLRSVRRHAAVTAMPT
jgi:UDPglucose 6-dehydrogenase